MAENRLSLERKLTIPAAIAQLEQCQREIDKRAKKKIEDVLKTIALIEKHSNGLKEPLFQRRNDFLNKIPKFWSTVLYNAAKTFPVFTNEEIECLKYVSSFTVQQFEDNKNSRTCLNVEISFEESNPFLKNGTVSKTVFWSDKHELVSKSTPLVWKEESDVDSLNKTQNKWFFNWMNEGPDTFSFKFTYLLEIWENPLQYYTFSSNGGADSDISYQQILDEIKSYQSEINELNTEEDSQIIRLLNDYHGAFCKNGKNYHLYEKRDAVIEMIPNFWASIFKNHPLISPFLEKEDIDFFKYLIKIEINLPLDICGSCISILVNGIFSKMDKTVLSKGSDRILYVRSMLIAQNQNDTHGSHSIPVLLKKNNFLINRLKKMTLSENEVEDGDRCSDHLNNFDCFKIEIDSELRYFLLLVLFKIWEDPMEFYLESFREESSWSVFGTVPELTGSKNMAPSDQ